MDELVGTILDGRYRVEAEVGRGAMGIVYRAVQLPIGRPVAIKLLNDHPGTTRLRRFELEAAVIATLRHANTVKLIEFQPRSDFHERAYIVTEFLSGRTLAQAVQPGGLPTAQVLSYLLLISDALAEAHEHGILHRDVKPENVFLEIVSGREQIKVIDFGIAKVLGTDPAKLTAPQTVVGTLYYMSPEQASGEADAPSADVYSLGVLAYQLLTGTLPFVGQTPMKILLGHAQDPVPPLRPRRRASLDLPPALDELVLRMLAKKPEDRPPNGAAVCAAVEEIALAIGRVSRQDVMGTVLAAELADALLAVNITPPASNDAMPETITAPPERKPLRSVPATLVRDPQRARSSLAPVRERLRAKQVVLGGAMLLVVGAISIFGWSAVRDRTPLGADAGVAGDAAIVVVPEPSAAPVPVSRPERESRPSKPAATNSEPGTDDLDPVHGRIRSPR